MLICDKPDQSLDTEPRSNSGLSVNCQCTVNATKVNKVTEQHKLCFLDCRTRPTRLLLEGNNLRQLVLPFQTYNFDSNMEVKFATKDHNCLEGSKN